MESTDGGLTTDARAVPPRNENEKDFSATGKEERQSQQVQERIKKRTPKDFHHLKGGVQTNVINIVNGNGIHIGDRVVVNVASAGRSGKIVRTKEISSLLENKRKVTKDDLYTIKSHIGENWKDVARGLGYTDGQIFQFYEDYRSTGISEVIYQLLLDWIQNNPETATVGLLTTTLWKNHEKGAVHLLAYKD